MDLGFEIFEVVVEVVRGLDAELLVVFEVLLVDVRGRGGLKGLGAIIQRLDGVCLRDVRVNEWMVGDFGGVWVEVEVEVEVRDDAIFRKTRLHVRSILPFKAISDNK